MTVVEAAFNVKLRPVCTVIEIILSALARLIGAEGADVYFGILSREEVEGLSFYSHDKGENDRERYDDIRVGRIQLIFSRKP